MSRPSPIVEAQIITGQGTCERCRDAVFETYAGPMVRHQCFLTSPSPATVTDDDVRYIIVMLGLEEDIGDAIAFEMVRQILATRFGPALARLRELEARIAGFERRESKHYLSMLHAAHVIGLARAANKMTPEIEHVGRAILGECPSPCGQKCPCCRGSGQHGPETPCSKCFGAGYLTGSDGKGKE